MMKKLILLLFFSVVSISAIGAPIVTFYPGNRGTINSTYRTFTYEFTADGYFNYTFTINGNGHTFTTDEIIDVYVNLSDDNGDTFDHFNGGVFIRAILRWPSLTAPEVTPSAVQFMWLRLEAILT